GMVRRVAQEVCGEYAELEPGIGAAALFEPLEVEAPVNAVVDAVPPQRTVDWRHGAPDPRPRSIVHPSNAAVKTIHQIRTGAQGSKRSVGPCDPRLNWFINDAGFDLRQHGGIDVQRGQRLSDSFQRVPDGTEVAAIREVLGAVHRWHEFVKDEPRFGI